MLTYDSQAHKDADKALLELARVALDITPSALRLDECGLWYLRGKRGRITTWGDERGYLLTLYARSRKAWFFAKQRLICATCTQDADGEGCFRFELPVTDHQAAEIRELAGLRRKLADETLALMSQRAIQGGLGRTTAAEAA